MTRTFNLSLIAALALGTSAMAQFTCPDLVSRTDTVNQSIGSKLNDVAMGDFTLSREPKIGDISTPDFKKATWELVENKLSFTCEYDQGTYKSSAIPGEYTSCSFPGEAASAGKTGGYCTTGVKECALDCVQKSPTAK